MSLTDRNHPTSQLRLPGHPLDLPGGNSNPVPLGLLAHGFVSPPPNMPDIHRRLSAPWTKIHGAIPDHNFRRAGLGALDRFPPSKTHC